MKNDQLVKKTGFRGMLRSPCVNTGCLNWLTAFWCCEILLQGTVITRVFTFIRDGWLTGPTNQRSDFIFLKTSSLWGTRFSEYISWWRDKLKNTQSSPLNSTPSNLISQTSSCIYTIYFSVKQPCLICCQRNKQDFVSNIFLVDFIGC